MPGLESWRHACSRCGRVWALSVRRWQCVCGGLLDLVGPLADPLGGSAAGSPLIRYGAALPPGAGSADLGLTVTRTAELRPGVFVKADYEQPTGSFKDRGASVMLGVAALLGVESTVVDSSGNAGKAAAAHAARAGIACTVYVPASTPADKVEAMVAYGAEVVEVPGGRQAAADAAQLDVASTGRFHASHVHQPLFHHGVKTLAFELFEQVEGLSGGTVIVPAGNGTLVLGLWLGFGELVAVGRMPRRPAIVAVQAAACAPLAGRGGSVAGGRAGGGDAAGGAGGGDAAGGAGGGDAAGGAAGGDAAGGAAGGDAAGGAVSGTVAAGIAIPAPPRAVQIRAAVLASGGRILVVGEEEIHAARSELAEMGFEVEPTGAVAWAGLGAWMGDEAGRGGSAGRRGDAEQPGPVVVVLTGR